MARVKFNGGNPAVFCDNCEVIVRYVDAMTSEGLRRQVEELKDLDVYCEECK